MAQAEQGEALADEALAKYQSDVLADAALEEDLAEDEALTALMVVEAELAE